MAQESTDNDREDRDERFAKWQGVTREHLGATSNLILGLATGLLGFTTVLLLEKKLVVSRAFGLGVAASFFLSVSIVLALWCATNRLTDFRLTAKIANPKNSSSPELERYREESRRLGERTWNAFRAQLWTFALGGASIGASIIIQVFSSGERRGDISTMPSPWALNVVGLSDQHACGCVDVLLSAQGRHVYREWGTDRELGR